MAITLQDADFALQQADAAWTLARSRVANAQSRIDRRADSYGTDAIGIAARARDQALLDQANQEAATTQTAYNAALVNYKTIYSAAETAVSPQPTVSPPTPPQSVTSNETQNPNPDIATEQAAGPQATVFVPSSISVQSTEVSETSLEPLQEPPQVTRDEFDGIDQQVADNENTLKEPPELSDEEVNAYLEPGGGADEAIREQLQAEADARQDDEAYQAALQEYVDSEPASAGGSASSIAKKSAVSAGSKTPYAADDWRVRLSLAPSANYLYKIASKADILYPLIATDGVVFPYTPQINSSYRANYDPAELTHSNYKMFFYKNSSVDDISITADFTAQDTAEANYMLAVIHFFKSATKMFYGQDTAPRAGTPPPLLYITGYGPHQFQNHPLLLTNFSYNLPNDVDYIRAGSNSQWGGIDIAKVKSGSSTRLGANGLTPGGTAAPASFSGIASKDAVTYVPTKISLSISLVPVVTRNDISKNFSLKDYAAGTLSKKTTGGIW